MDDDREIIDPSMRVTLARFASDQTAANRRFSYDRLAGRWAWSTLPPPPFPEANWAVLVQPLICVASLSHTPKVVDFSQVSHRRFNQAEYTGRRYRRADPRFPGILIDGGENPDGLRYRLIDGKHRMHKMLERRLEEAPFLVVSVAEVTPFIHYIPNKGTRGW